MARQPQTKVYLVCFNDIECINNHCRTTNFVHILCIISYILPVLSCNETAQCLDLVANGALLLLPSLLPEAQVACLSAGKGQKRAYWKPSIVESMHNFVDIQQVILHV